MAKQSWPLEHEEQAAVVQWFDLQYPQLSRLLFAIPNGANKSIAAAMKFKREGLRAGFPDLGLAVGRRGYKGMFMEMKRVKGSFVTPEQLQYIHELSEQGFYVCVGYGFDDARKRIDWYLTR